MMAYNRKEDILNFVKENPGLPALRIISAFGSDISFTLINLEKAGLIKSKKEFNGVGCAWRVKCYYPREDKK
jgi:predicted transcriptional regulator